MKFFGWLLFVGSIVWAAMIIADPSKVVDMGFGDDDVPEHVHVHSAMSTASATACSRCEVRAAQGGTRFCGDCKSAELNYMKISGDSKPGIRATKDKPAVLLASSDAIAPLEYPSVRSGTITPFHIQFTVASICIPMLLGVFFIFGVDHEKTKS